jgi:hypothetical protein
MTLTSEIITDAFRQSNLLAIGVSPTALQLAESLRYLNRIVKSVFGNEVGDPLTAFPLGRDNISRPSGYPYWNNTPAFDWYVPKNVRVMLNLTDSIQLWLHPQPDDGSRFAAIDASNDISTFPVTVNGNGRTIEGATSIILNTDGYNAEWMYRDDLANWQKTAPLLLTDDFPFPEEFDFFFIVQLAMTMNPTFGIQMDPQTSETYRRAKSQLRARYHQTIPVHSELGLIRPTRTAIDRDRWGSNYWFYDPTAMFNTGYPW